MSPPIHYIGKYFKTVIFKKDMPQIRGHIGCTPRTNNDHGIYDGGAYEVTKGMKSSCDERLSMT